MFCKRCGLPVKWYGTKGWLHTLPSGVAITVAHDAEPGQLSEVQPQAVGGEDAPGGV